uniref:Uncharacterized protein n=1 Tax=Oryza meridionalis TaxID=40149 RepID=A0A0E0EGV7_9ORYZ
MASYYPLLLALLCPLLLLLLKCCWAKTRDDELFDKLPSPPGRLPVIGHLHLIGSLPHISFRDLAVKHGPDLMLLHLGTVPTLVVSSARAAQAILRTHDHVFASRAYSAVTDILFYGSSDVAFAPYGDYWRQVKKITTTHLLTSKKVRSYASARQQEVRLVMARINEAAIVGMPVDLSQLLNWFTNDIVCHAVSGKLFREKGQNQVFRELIEANSSLLSGFNLEDYFPGLASLAAVRRLLCAKAHYVNKKWDQLLDKLIDDHTSKQSSSMLDKKDEDIDFIDVLLSVQYEYGLTRENIKAILVIMFEGGTDTSYIELEYAMAELMQKPQLMAKLQAEVRSVVPREQEIVTEEQLNRVPYLEAVIKETLRLHMAAPLLVPHLSIADCEVEGYMIPSSTRVFINAWALSRDPSYWKNAEEFVPERFIGNTTSDYRGNDFYFLPFGTGRRICPGINFAIATIKIMLANLVYRFDWEIPTDEAAKGGIDMAETFGLTIPLYIYGRICGMALSAGMSGGMLSKLPSPPGRLPHGPDLMLLHLGAVQTLVVSSARTAQAILRTHDRVFASRPYNTIANILLYSATDVAFSPYGDYWRQIKKIVSTHLLTVKKVHSYGQTRQQEVRLVMTKIAKEAAIHMAVDLTKLLSCYTNNLVCHAVSGKFFREEGRNQLFKELIEINSSLLGGFNLEDYFPSLARLPVLRRLLCAKAYGVKKRWDQLLDKLIDDHASKHRSSFLDNNDVESDFIDVLLSIQQEYGLTKDNIKANLAIMFEAGTDTSFIELEYAMAELMQKPQMMAKLQAEVRGVVPKGQEIVTEKQLARMPYLKAVIKETLRLHPAAPLLAPHVSVVDCNVEGYTIPSGTRVIVNAWAIARDPSYWENAEEFMPERFLSNTMAEYNGNNFNFLPFGTGRRICPSINFAIAAIEVMLASLVYRFDWKVPIDQAANGGIDMTETFGITIHLKEKLLLVPHLP